MDGIKEDPIFPRTVSAERATEHRLGRIFRWYDDYLVKPGTLEYRILLTFSHFRGPARLAWLELLGNTVPENDMTSWKESELHSGLNDLVALGLLQKREVDRSVEYSVHPLVGRRYRQECTADQSHVIHDNIYKLYKNIIPAPDLPDKLEDILRLFEAVYHGCKAGRYQEVLNEVYRRRIQRGENLWTTRKFGVFEAQVDALSGFFLQDASTVVGALDPPSKGYLLAERGFALRALGRIDEAIPVMQAALELAIAQGDWKNAAIRASHLRGLNLTSGDLDKTVQYARASVEYADRAGAERERVSNRTVLADALHFVGRDDEAGLLFREAEALQANSSPDKPLLYDVENFRYCLFLLDKGEYKDAKNRSEAALRIALEAAKKTPNQLNIALGYLASGQACSYLYLKGDASSITRAKDDLEKSIEFMRQAGRQDILPMGLLARADLRLSAGDHKGAEIDLGEAKKIADGAKMDQHRADCLLGLTRLRLAEVSLDKAFAIEEARAYLRDAKILILKMGYHRRDREVERLETALSRAAQPRR